MDRLQKYIQKIDITPKNTYIKKIIRYAIGNNNIAGQVGGLKISDFDSLLDFLRKRYTEINNNTEKKYFVILYGPPASGKSIARKIACHAIKEQYGEIISPHQIFETFVDTSIDEITYDVEVKTDNGYKKVSELLMENYNNFIKDIPEKDKLSHIKNNILDISGKSFNIYKSNRPDYVSELLLYFSVFLNRNIFMETAGTDIQYVNKIISSITWYGYKPIVIYPFINDVNILYDRSLSRGIKEGRFVTCNLLSSLIKQCQENYHLIKKTLVDFNNFFALQYNAQFNSDLYNELDQFNFDNFDKVDIIDKLYHYTSGQLKINNICKN